MSYMKTYNTEVSFPQMCRIAYPPPYLPTYPPKPAHLLLGVVVGLHCSKEATHFQYFISNLNILQFYDKVIWFEFKVYFYYVACLLTHGIQL